MVFNNELVNNILDAVFPLPENFGIILYANNYEEDELLQDIEYNIKQIDSTASIEYGMSKMVIISPKLENIVIKIPFNGYYMEEKDLDTEECKKVWEPFYWAPCSNTSDYCLAEFEKFDRLKTYDLDCFVAKTIYYKNIFDTNVFIQEQVTPVDCSEKVYRPSKKSRDIAEKWHEEEKIYMDTDWIANCIDKYGQSKVERFLNYCSNIDPDILEDMHGGNYGYREDGTPALLDFSNYLD